MDRGRRGHRYHLERCVQSPADPGVRDVALDRRPVFLNGKFAAQPLTGVQRVGHELVQALDRRLAAGAVAGAAHRWVLLCPPGARSMNLQAIVPRTVSDRALPLHLWEQLVLPFAAQAGLLVNLAGTGPWFAGRQVVLQHDAAVFDHPEAYTPAFVAWYRRLFARQVRCAQACLVVSAFSRARLAQALGQPPQRWNVSPLGADHLERVSPDARALERLQVAPGQYLLAVGSANPTKNLDALIAAYATLPLPRPPLLLVGGRNDRVFAEESVPARAAIPGLQRIGRVDDAALRALYEGALALVFPSVYEGFGLPPLEAMALGCPVLTTRCASLPEVCGEAAFYAESPDAAGLSVALRRLLEDADLRERLRHAGRAHSRRFTWDHAVQPLCAAIDAAGGAM